MAHLLLELYERLNTVGHVRSEGTACSYAMPLTQELLGDALGLSVVHVNRTLRVLREEGIVMAGFGNVTIHDLARLVEAAGSEDGSYIPTMEKTRITPTREE